MEPSNSLLAIVELCVAQNSDDAWRHFEGALAERLEAVFKRTATGRWSRQFSEFRPWFTNWAYARRLPHAAYRRLNKEQSQGRLLTELEQSEFLLNYLVKAATSSALPEFIKESVSKEDRLYQLATELSAPSTPEGAMDAVSSANLLALLNPSYRIPFLLRHYNDFGYPSEEDINWMAAVCRKTVGGVKGLLNDAIEANDGAAFPIPSPLIAELCGISESPDGGQAAVDQRVRRARLKLQELLSATGGGDV